MSAPSTPAVAGRQFFSAAVAALAATVAAALPLGQAMGEEGGASTTSRAVHLIVPAAPGGTADLLARAVSQQMAVSLAQPVIVDNKPGASTHIGTEAMVRSPADGYTLCLSGITLSTDPWLYNKLPYDPQKDIAPVVLLATSGNVLVINQNVPAMDVRSLITLARNRPGELHFGTPAIGSTGHLAGEMFNAMAHVDMVAVHYKGAAPALTDLIAGVIDMTFDNIPAALQYVRSGRLRALGVTSAKRSPVLPEVPTIAEAGVPGYDISAWFGLTAPAATPRETIVRLNRAAGEALATPEVRARIAALGFESVGGSPEEFGTLIQSDLRRLGEIIRKAGVKAE